MLRLAIKASIVIFLTLNIVAFFHAYSLYILQRVVS